MRCGAVLRDETCEREIVKKTVSDIILKGIRKKDEIGFKERKSGRK